MSQKRVYDDDDGRVIADMSGVERQPLLIPRLGRRDGRRSPNGQSREDRSFTGDDLTPQERRTVMFAAVKASLLIALAFIAVFGLIILVICLV